MQRRWCHLLAACPIPSRRWREKDSNPRSPARETTLRDCLLIEKVRFAADLYGAFPVKRLFFGFCSPFFVRSGKGRSSSRRLRSGSRSARKGSSDRNASAAWRRAALASLVFRSALTPEHAEGR